jgi:hypothetical protein
MNTNSGEWEVVVFWINKTLSYLSLVKLFEI